VKICDRTWYRTGKVVPATTTLILGVEEFALCESEAQKVRQFLVEPVKQSRLSLAKDRLGLGGKPKGTSEQPSH
jgi:hypothetical protein